MAWYDDKSRRAHVATYVNAVEASSDSEQATNNGWIVSNTETAQGHTDRFKTAANVAGIVGSLFGRARRPADTITITYGRPPNWLAHHT